MVPPKNRRPGYSRKAQYGLFLGYVVAIGGALFALLLLVVAAFDPQGFSVIRTAMSDATAPVPAGGRGIARGLQNAVAEVTAYIDAGSKNRALILELERQRIAHGRTRAIEAENGRLKALLRIVESERQPIAAGRLVASSATSSRRFAVLNVGYNDGVRPGLPVRAATGLVGRVVAVGRSTAQVALVTDGGMVVPVRRARDGLPAIATGTGAGAVDVRALGAGDNPFKPGDVIVTSGIGGIYAPDVPVAVIARIAGDEALGRPLADPARIDFAVVEPMFQPQIQKPLAPLPPAPAPQ